MLDIQLYHYMEEMLKGIRSSFVRYLYHEINWDARMIGITGPRGVGKSTMVLQHIQRTRADGHALYVMADNLYFSQHTLVSLADEFVKEGGTHLYIDEIHKYTSWSRELKQIYDVHPKLHIVFTGSSVLDILHGTADLSRRALMYSMQGLSFREYLQLFHHIILPAYSLQEILGHQVTLPEQMPHPLPLFRTYLQEGYYPFALEGDLMPRLLQVVALSVEVDIPQYADMKAATTRKLRQMLTVIATLAPFKPNADSLASEIGVSKNNIPDYLVYLERAGLIGLLRDDTQGLRGLGKVEKAYLDNPTLMTILGNGQTDTGNMRETFFYNQMRVRHAVTASRQSDFVVDGITFEVGGRKKGKKQIEGLPDAFIVRDDIETGHGIYVPLWQFGLNY